MLWLVFVDCVSIAFTCFVRAVMLVSCMLLLVCMVRMWCVVLLVVVSSVCRACVWCCWSFVFVLVYCYGVNAFPVCDCMLYVPSLRCSFLVVRCCLFVYVFMLWRVVVVCLSMSLICFVCDVMFLSCIRCVGCVCVVCGVLCCCLFSH